jgi:hypothetical protein
MLCVMLWVVRDCPKLPRIERDQKSKYDSRDATAPFAPHKHAPSHVFKVLFPDGLSVAMANVAGKLPQLNLFVMGKRYTRVKQPDKHGLNQSLSLTRQDPMQASASGAPPGLPFLHSHIS